MYIFFYCLFLVWRAIFAYRVVIGLFLSTTQTKVVIIEANFISEKGDNFLLKLGFQLLEDS